MGTGTRAIVIGAGAPGLCCARELRAAGFDVTVVDAAAPGSGCSWGNAGLVTPSHFVPLAEASLLWKGLKWMLNPSSPFYLRPRLDFGLLAWLGRFAWAARRSTCEVHTLVLRDLLLESRRRFDGLAELDFGFEAKGLLMLHRSPEGKAGNVHEAELGRRLGLHPRLVSGTDLEVLEPSGVIQAGEAVFWPDDAHLDPARFTAALAAEAQANGVTFLQAAAAAFVAEGGRVRGVRTSGGDVEGDVFVLAAGCASPGLSKTLGLKLPMQPGKGYSFDVVPSRLPRLPSILAEARVAVTPMGDRLRLAGTMELSGMDLSISRRRVEAIHRASKDYLDLEMPPIPEQPWAGLRPCSPDGLPYLGPFTRFPNLHAATGHAMLGIGLAPITGVLVAEAATGAKPTLPLEPFRPDRFA
ncbi:MAG: FAD-dependent oxidoreductase [Holophagaceae bacterium]